MKGDGTRASSSPIFLITAQAKTECLTSSPDRIFLRQRAPVRLKLLYPIYINIEIHPW